MKLKCDDGIVREFSLSGISSIQTWFEAECTHCLKGFGVHDTRILKPLFKAHTCDMKELPESKR